jgi:hypothetical protein
VARADFWNRFTDAVEQNANPCPVYDVTRGALMHIHGIIRPLPADAAERGLDLHG